MFRFKNILSFLIVLCIPLSSIAAITANEIQNYNSQTIFPDRAIADNGVMYVCSSATGVIYKVTNSNDIITTTPFAQLPTTFNGGPAFTIGVEVDRDGFVYASNGSGIYKIGPKGGNYLDNPSVNPDRPELIIPNAGQFAVPEALALNGAYLYMADVVFGNIWQIDLRTNTAVLWMAGTSHPELQAITLSSGSNPANLPLGIVGIKISPDKKSLYGVNIEKGTLLKIDISKDNSAGNLSVVAQFPEGLNPSGLYIDNESKIYISTLFRNFVSSSPVVDGRLFLFDSKRNSPTLTQLADQSTLGIGTFAEVVGGRGFDDTKDYKNKTKVLYLTDGALDNLFMGAPYRSRIVRVILDND